MADVTSIYGNPIKDAVARADIATNTQDISDLKDGFSDMDDRVTVLEQGGQGTAVVEVGVGDDDSVDVGDGIGLGHREVGGGLGSGVQ